MGVAPSAAWRGLPSTSLAPRIPSPRQPRPPPPQSINKRVRGGGRWGGKGLRLEGRVLQLEWGGGVLPRAVGARPPIWGLSILAVELNVLWCSPNPPRPPLLRGRFDIEIRSNEIDVESMSNQCRIDAKLTPEEGKASRIRG